MSQGLTVTTDGFEGGFQGAINDAQVVKQRQEAERRAREQANSRNASSATSGSSGYSMGEMQEKNYSCNLVCRQSGFVSYKTQNMGGVTFRAYPHQVSDKLNAICNKLSGAWYVDTDSCPRY
ncbi:hypothetical protein [Azospirillum isscasi]|uniref:Uncharacterized protein n=1 Tax=Azospirillum isscasi TaxID=3053926 RepID=A0ABU0WRJ7_9PROT|nr:hypothetical protein [Azospirillum isscasi]MDQ2106568.1 hypothetical protein [Azospirillum isscasi]